MLTSRWMLWLATAGLRGGLKLEAYHQSRQPQSFFLCGSQRRCGVVSDALSRQPSSSSTSLRQASGTSLSDISASPDVEASHITRRRATATLWLSVFWVCGSLFRTLRRHFLRAVAAAVSSSTSQRRPRLRVAAQASRASHSRCSCSSRR